MMSALIALDPASEIGARDALSKIQHRRRSRVRSSPAYLASVCRTHPVVRLPDELVGRLDSTIASTLQEPASEERNEALVSLAGIRSGLFPEAPTYRPLQLEPQEMAA
jgi:hypothetical protein